MVGAGGGLAFESVDGVDQRPSIGLDLDVNGTELAFSPDGTQVLGRSNPGSALDGWFVMDIESGVSDAARRSTGCLRLMAAGRTALTLT